MKKIITFTLLIIVTSITLSAQSIVLPKDYSFHICSEHCGVIEYTGTRTTISVRSLSAIWNEPIRVTVGIHEGETVDSMTILNNLATDSDIAISEGLYTGTGDAFILGGIIYDVDLSPIADAGYPMTTQMVNIALSTINDQTLGDMLDNYILEARDCHGSQKFIMVVGDNFGGLQEVTTGGLPPSENKHPTETMKKGAYSNVNFRNHAISHNAGKNHSTHQNGPDPTKHPMQTVDGKSYGWSTTGLAGFSGGTNLGIGPNGEDIAGYIRSSHNEWLSIIPNLSITNMTGPVTAEVDENVSFSVEINKELTDTVYTWTFTHTTSGSMISGSNNPMSLSFPQAGEWTYIVTVANACGGQTTEASGSITLTSNQQAPTALCQNITLILDSNGEAEAEGVDIDGGSTDPDGTIISRLIDGNASITFDCDDLGSHPVTLVVTDNDGLSSSCQAVITVVDDEFPAVDCIGNLTIKLTANQDTILSGSDINLAVSDNCSISIDLDNNTFNGNNPGIYAMKAIITDNSGNMTECVTEVTVEMSTATIEVTDTDLLNIYPNPMSDYLHIEIDRSIEVKSIVLYSILGQEAIKMGRTQSGSVDLDVSSLVSGYYLITITGNDGHRYIERLSKN